MDGVGYVPEGRMAGRRSRSPCVRTAQIKEGTTLNTNASNLSRRNFLKLSGVFGASAALFAVTGCGSDGGSASSDAASDSSASDAEMKTAADLSGKTLNIYCGAGMTEPFKKIAQDFQDETGCTMNVTYANAAQIQTQINESESGDLWIAGSGEEAKRVADVTTKSTDLVKHIPVLVVPSSNPKDVHALADLGNVDSLLIGDPESVAIGKVAKKALSDAGLWDSLQDKITTTTTAPQIATALASDQGDAGIVWKENMVDGVVSVADDEMSAYTKTILAVELSYTQDQETLDAFMSYLGGDEAKAVWTAAGYEIA